MDSKEILKEMFILQHKLNNETNGIGWESGYTKNNKLINWKRCIYMECAELIDSFSWKHWKNIEDPTNWDNVTIEIVDIWHFIMSLFLEHYANNNIGDIDKIVEDISNTRGFKFFCKDAYGINEHENMEIINLVEKIIHLTTGFKMDLFDGLLRFYFDLALKCGVNLNSLYRFYIGKNVLNQFRQDHGYKEGHYKKTWDNKEDNEVMVEILESGEKSAKTLYTLLENEYKKL